MLTRRDALKAAAVAALLPAAARAARPAAAGFTLPPLPYPEDALEPHIDAETMRTHHGKHHKTYVDNLNAALKEHPDWLAKPVTEVITRLKDVPENVRTAVRNNGGGHFNHSLFWMVMAKPAGGTPAPKGELMQAIDASFGSFDEFKKQFKAAGTGRFGSGWAWLVPGSGGKPLAITSSPNQDSPLMDGGPAPVLGLDVWEHAYYLKYKSQRAAYIDAWWNVVNWDQVAANYAAVKKG